MSDEYILLTGYLVFAVVMVGLVAVCWPFLRDKPDPRLLTVKQLVQQGRKLSELSGDELCELYQDREITAEIFNVIEREVINRMIAGKDE